MSDVEGVDEVLVRKRSMVWLQLARLPVEHREVSYWNGNRGIFCELCKRKGTPMHYADTEHQEALRIKGPRWEHARQKAHEKRVEHDMETLPAPVPLPDVEPWDRLDPEQEGVLQHANQHAHPNRRCQLRMLCNELKALEEDRTRLRSRLYALWVEQGEIDKDDHVLHLLIQAKLRAIQEVLAGELA